MTAKISFYGRELNTYRANLHMHSTNSDGVYSLGELIDLYGKEGYDVLAATDHYRTNKVSETDSGKLLMLSGMEFHPVGPRGLRLHLLAINIPEDFEDPSSLPYQEAIDAVRAVGGECILAHPYWCGLNCSDIMQIKNLTALEVYNSDTRFIGKGNSVQVWDNILQLGYHLPAVAVDDTHRARDFFGGWTMICAGEKTVSSVMEALKNGTYFATQGPVFHKLNFENNVFSVECSPCEELIVMSDCSFGICGSMSGLKAQNPAESKDSCEITHFETEIPDAPTLTYIRCQIKDKNGRYAWSAPVRI
ncbi:MAG: CehA/McbA family metallohydrolase [Victivallaceae bacterium]|nr:CehA/McbA family metallohydrolase [Victivallaceae bacterium]